MKKRSKILLTASVLSMLCASAMADTNTTNNATDIHFVGENNNVSDSQYVNVIGHMNTVKDGFDVNVVGFRNSAIGRHNIVLGTYSGALGNDSIAIGDNAGARASKPGDAWDAATGRGAVSIGKFATSEGEYTTSLGYMAESDGEYNVAVGAHSMAYKDDFHKVDSKYAGVSNAKGVFSIANGSGYSPMRYLANSPVGANQYEDTHDTNPIVNIGEFTRQLQGVAAGELSATSTDAVNGSQLYTEIKETREMLKVPMDWLENHEARIETNKQNIKDLAIGVSMLGDAVKENTDNIAMNTKLANDAMEEAKKHTVVSSGDNNIDVTNITLPNYDGTITKANEYAVSLNKNINIQSAEFNSEDENDDHRIDITSTHVQASGSDPFGNKRTASMNKDGFNAVDGNQYSGLQSSYLHFGDTAKQESAHYSIKGIRLADNNSDPIEITKENVSFGDRQIHDVKAGTAATDAVNVSQLKEVEKKIANFDSSSIVNQAKSYTDAQTAKVGAAAAALSALHPLDFDRDDKWSFGVGFGNYKNANATSLGAFYRPNENTMINVATTLGDDRNMVNVGANFKFGPAPKKLSAAKQVELETKVQDLTTKYEALEAKYNALVAKLESK